MRDRRTSDPRHPIDPRRGADPERPALGPRETWHSLLERDVLAALASDGAQGLSPAEVRRRQERFGRNDLGETRRHTAVAVFLEQFKSPLIYLLFAAAAVALALGKRGDAAVIFGVVLANALIGAFQEGRAERSMEALRRLAGRTARVLREGREELLDAGELVPGDVMLLAAGDAVAADARVIDGAALQIAEAALTGEAEPVAKGRIPLAPDTPLADRKNMVYAGTHVTAGRARALVVATGPATEIGRIAALAASAEPPKTPLERRITGFGHAIAIAALSMFALVIAIGWLRGLPLVEIGMVAISQVVGMIPEGLPVAMTIALAVGVQRMARRRAIVRRLAAVETLGSTTVVCTDKTGTLTRGEMTVTSIQLPAGLQIPVAGSGYTPDGVLGEVPPDDAGDLAALVEAGALCNDARLLGPGPDEPGWRVLGDPTEGALLVLAVKAGLVPEDLQQRLPRNAEIPFDPASKLMATQHERDERPVVVLKGAPEVVLDLCSEARCGGRTVPLDPALRVRLGEGVDTMARQALRVLALARVEDAEIDGRSGFEAFRGRGTLLGFVGQMDPPRPEVGRAIEACRAAGIRPVMVTGDHKATGAAVARMLRMLDGDPGAVDGRDLERLSDEELAERIHRISVFARVHPAQKLRIVAAYQRRGEVVAMTGDGVNDAPALARADVGVAMGRTGTDVAKEAAQLVITDDDFATIVAAVEEGRLVYRNLKKVILYLFSTSLAEVVVLVGALLLGFPPPLAAVQILWINLVTEGTVTVNLVMEPLEGDEMRRPPIPRAEPLLTRTMLSRMALMTPTIAASTLGWFLVRSAMGVSYPEVQTETFTVLAVCQWFNVLNCRSATRSALSLGVFANRWLLGGLVVSNLLQAAVVFVPEMNRLFHTVPMDLHEVVGIGAVASAVLWVEEARKAVARRREARAAEAPARRG
jgi:magnesium-transporting ATPase (P-type)